MPLLLASVLIGFFLWLEDNISDDLRDPAVSQPGRRLSRRAFVKWSSWSRLVIMTFTIVATLKHIKAGFTSLSRVGDTDQGVKKLD
jgi:uncharacterized membrane protein YoaT (DUF817 family)